MRKLIVALAVVSTALLLGVPAGYAAKGGGGGNSTSSKMCQKGGYLKLVGSGGEDFSTQDACTSYAAGGHTLLPDSDSDGVANSSDTCPNVANPTQTDTDNDGTGDVCDSTPNGPDADGDAVPDPSDNCPNASNPAQTDTDADGLGDACEPPTLSLTVTMVEATEWNSEWHITGSNLPPGAEIGAQIELTQAHYDWLVANGLGDTVSGPDRWDDSGLTTESTPDADGNLDETSLRGFSCPIVYPLEVPAFSRYRAYVVVDSERLYSNAVPFPC